VQRFARKMQFLMLPLLFESSRMPPPRSWFEERMMA
jgi:hypothetical protein